MIQAEVPVVLLHAFPLHAGLFDGVRDTLGKRLLTPNLRGFGGTPLGNDEPDLARYADDVAALLDREGVAAAIIGGVSIGGYITMEFVRRHRDRVAGLILANTKADADADPARANRERIAARLDAEQSPQVLLDDVFPALLGATTKARRPDVLRRVRDMVADCDPAAAAWAQRAMARRPDSHDTLRSVAGLPAHIIAAEEDALSTADNARTMLNALSQDGLPQAGFSRIPTCGHLSPMEAPAAFAAAVGVLLG